MSESLPTEMTVLTDVNVLGIALTRTIRPAVACIRGSKTYSMG